MEATSGTMDIAMEVERGMTPAIMIITPENIYVTATITITFQDTTTFIKPDTGIGSAGVTMATIAKNAGMR